MKNDSEKAGLALHIKRQNEHEEICKSVINYENAKVDNQFVILTSFIHRDSVAVKSSVEDSTGSHSDGQLHVSCRTRTSP